MAAAADRRRYPLQLQRHKPVALKEYAPRFDESFNPGKKRDVDEERQHAKRLQHVYKREFKAAKRELRKDNQFLADVKLKETIEKDREYKEKIKGIYSMVLARRLARGGQAGGAQWADPSSVPSGVVATTARAGAGGHDAGGEAQAQEAQVIVASRVCQRRAHWACGLAYNPVYSIFACYTCTVAPT